MIKQKKDKKKKNNKKTAIISYVPTEVTTPLK
jgi:hypothetical protein